MKLLLLETLILFSIVGMLLFIGLRQNQLIRTNVKACTWVIDQGMEAPEHCEPYL